MTLSIFTTTTNPLERGDPYHEAIKCYKDLADEVVVVNGGGQLTEQSGIKYVNYKWPKEFSWDFIGKQFTRGYKACTSDWVIHADLDFLFHEKDFEEIRQVLGSHPHAPALSFYKWQFTMPDRYNLKSRLVIAVNKGEYGDRIKFDSSGDLCQPSLDGKYLSPDDVPESGIEFYNYEKLLKTEEQIKDDVERMARAWHRHFGDYKLGTDDTAYSEWLQMALGRLGKPHKHIPIHEHPKYIQDTILKLRPDQWGYNAFGKLEDNNYVGVAHA
jgi:glycosyltransferase involved in cell wall biosynthesis